MRPIFLLCVLIALWGHCEHVSAYPRRAASLQSVFCKALDAKRISIPVFAIDPERKFSTIQHFKMFVSCYYVDPPVALFRWRKGRVGERVASCLLPTRQKSSRRHCVTYRNISFHLSAPLRLAKSIGAIRFHQDQSSLRLSILCGSDA